MSANEVILNYQGPVDFETTEKLLRQVKDKLASHDIKKVYKKRVYSILVECIENILRHTDGNREESVDPYIRLEKGILEYKITTSNLLLKSNLSLIKEKLSIIAKSDKEQLQKMYKDQINKEIDLTKNSAGLGFITIALKSNSPLYYEFNEVDEQFSVFELRVTIPIDNN